MRFLTVFLIFIAETALFAQPTRVAARVNGRIESSTPVELPGHVPVHAQPQFDRGPADPSLYLPDLSFVFKPSAQQQQDLDQFLIDQQNPASASYHHWLTPEEYADHFGINQSDMKLVEDWLTAQGFQVSYRGRARNWLTFGGTALQVERTFHTPIHRYLVDGEAHYANSAEPSIPAALAGLISTVRGLNDFRPKPAGRVRPVPERLQPNFNDSGGNHFLAPDDLATIYNLTPLYNAGFDGTGQKIAIVGQSDIKLSDIAAFRSIFNLSPNVPQLVLFGRDPGIRTGDQAESELDVEWAGAVARNATVVFVYSSGVFNSLQYAVDQNVAPVISMSYGSCESSSAGSLDAFRTVAQQAATQGISWLASSGDSGAAACDSDTLARASQGTAVNFPASIPEVTGVGGTEFNEGGGSYWNPTNGTNQGSALSYIPEMAWNDTTTNGTITASGGGTSVHYPTPTWQTGAGFPNDGHRDVPDVALTASADHDGFIVCLGITNCPANWKSLGEGSGYIVYGGTSASSPSFAGILTLVNHYLVSKGIQSTAGLGSANPTLYALAQANPQVFHDITSGNNIVPCKIGTTSCTSGSFGFSAGTGYDQATGLGSVDGFNLAIAWAGSLVPQITGISPAAPPISSNVQTVTVAGSGFQAGATISLVSPTNGVSSPVASNITPNSLQVSVTLNLAGTWKLAVIDPNGRQSSLFSFTVAAGQTAPAVIVSSASPVAISSATLNGLVNPNGGDTQVSFLYGTSSTLAGATQTTQQDIGAGSSLTGVSAGLTNLTGGTTYYFQLLASNSAGVTRSNILSFTTGGGKSPTVTTSAASAVSNSGVTLNGVVNPNALDTKIWFQYSTSSSLTNSVSTPLQDIGTGSSAVGVSALLSGLASNTTYYFQAWASNSTGSSQGAILSFTTSQVATVSTAPATSFTSSSAIVGGSVNPNGADTLVWFQYGTSSTLSGSTATAQQDIGAGNSAVPVSAVLNGLANGATYYFQAWASNSAGISQGAILSFTTATFTVPGTPLEISPANGAVNVTSSPILTWSPAANATGYTLLFGPTNPPTNAIVLSGANSTSYSLGLITGLTTYYWQVVATNAAGSTSSPVGIFSTGSLVMPGTKVGVFRNGNNVIEDTNGNGLYDPGIDRFIAAFNGPQGFLAGDIPVAGDWTGDGHAKVGIYRSTTGTWYLDANNDGVYDTGDYTYQYGGLPGDLPVVGDWNSAPGVSVHKTCIGIYRAQGSFWLLDLNCNGVFEGTPADSFFPFGGLSGDVPVVGNWTGGKTRVGVVRKYAPGGVPQGEPFYWVLDNGDPNAGNDPANHPAADGSFPFGGLPGDVFITGDWNNSGASKAGVFRAGGIAGAQPFEWVLDANARHTPDVVFNLYGVAGDKGITGKW